MIKTVEHAEQLARHPEKRNAGAGAKYSEGVLEKSGEAPEVSDRSGRPRACGECGQVHGMPLQEYPVDSRAHDDAT